MQRFSSCLEQVYKENSGEGKLGQIHLKRSLNGGDQ